MTLDMLQQEADLPLGRRGSIINVASLLTFQGGITVPAYAASKGGVGQLTKALSNEWAAKGINVNAIAPGYIATDMNEVCHTYPLLPLPQTHQRRKIYDEHVLIFYITGVNRRREARRKYTKQNPSWTVGFS